MQQLGDSVALMYDRGRGQRPSTHADWPLVADVTGQNDLGEGRSSEVLVWRRSVGLIQLRARRSRERTLHMAGHR